MGNIEDHKRLLEKFKQERRVLKKENQLLKTVAQDFSHKMSVHLVNISLATDGITILLSNNTNETRSQESVNEIRFICEKLKESCGKVSAIIESSRKKINATQSVKASSKPTKFIHHENQFHGLSMKQYQCLALLANDFSVEEIGDMLDIRAPTVYSHLLQIKEKLDVKKLSALTIVGLKNGLDQLPRAELLGFRKKSKN